MRALLQKMLQVDPSARPSIGEVLNAPLFRTGLDTVMQRDLIDGLDKDVHRLEAQVWVGGVGGVWEGEMDVLKICVGRMGGCIEEL